MSRNGSGRRCAAVSKDGRPCQAWAIRGSKPARCAVHAGRCVGPGAPAGNRNALKHGYYARHFTEQEMAELREMTARSPAGELVVARAMIGRLLAYLDKETISPAEMATVMPLIFSGIRRVLQVLERLGDEAVDWDFVLGELSEEWGREL